MGARARAVRRARRSERAGMAQAHRDDERGCGRRSPRCRRARLHVAEPLGRRGRRDGRRAAFAGATEPPGGPPRRGRGARGGRPAAAPPGATLYSTLEPCDHTGRTGPCTEAIIAAGVARVVVGMSRPRPARRRPGHRAAPRRRHRGRRRRRAGRGRPRQLAPYLKHRRTGRPWVVLKLAASLDGRTAAPDGSSAVDHRRRRRAPTPTGCGPRATP